MASFANMIFQEKNQENPSKKFPERLALNLKQGQSATITKRISPFNFVP